MCLAQQVQSAINLKSRIWKLLVISYFLWPSKRTKTYTTSLVEETSFAFFIFYKTTAFRGPKCGPRHMVQTQGKQKTKTSWMQNMYLHTHIYILFHMSSSFVFNESVIGMGLERKGKRGSRNFSWCLPHDAQKWREMGDRRTKETKSRQLPPQSQSETPCPAPGSLKSRWRPQWKWRTGESNQGWSCVLPQRQGLGGQHAAPRGPQELLETEQQQRQVWLWLCELTLVTEHVHRMRIVFLWNPALQHFTSF